MIHGRIETLELDPTHNKIHNLLFRSSQGVVDKKFTSVPTTDEVPVGYLAFYESGATMRVYVNFYGTMRYFALT